MRKWLIVLSVLSMSTVSGAPAWRWVDSNGTVHYSDRPMPGATQIELGGAQTFSAPPRSTRGSAAGQPSETTGRYQALEIVSPAEQETLWNTGGTLAVRVQMQPQLAAGHRIDLVYDGQPLNLNSTSTSFTLSDVFRGAHTLQAVIRDASGSELQRSPTRNFVVQQISIQNPNAPLARPPRTN